jgi:hypothetical protein
MQINAPERGTMHILRMAANDRCRAGRVPGTRPTYSSGDQPSAGLQTEAVVQILNAHIAGALLTCFILDCSMRIGEQRRRARPDQDTIAKLTGMQREAQELRRALDPSDAALVQTILRHYSPVVWNKIG